jgi:hypothetical protein
METEPQIVSFVVVDAETNSVIDSNEILAYHACSPDFHLPSNEDTDALAYYDEQMAQHSFVSHPSMNKYIADLVRYVRTDGTVTVGDVYDPKTGKFTANTVEPPIDRPWVHDYVGPESATLPDA